MAKNKARKNKPAVKEKAQDLQPVAAEPVSEDKDTAAVDKNKGKGGNNNAKPKEILYQVKCKRDAGVLKAFITFNYRVLHPGVTPRLILYGLIIGAPGIFFFKDLYWKCFFIGVGIMLILLGLFRQYISLAMTKKNDPDYQNGTEFTYNFTAVDAEFLRDGTRFSKLDRYKDITNFYYDDDYFYLGLASRELFVIPKNAFTIGDADGFEEFIYKKSKHTCRWIPANFSGWLKKRRASRAVSADKMMK